MGLLFAGNVAGMSRRGLVRGCIALIAVPNWVGWWLGSYPRGWNDVFWRERSRGGLSDYYQSDSLASGLY